MKILNRIIAIFIGGLFIFSGGVKAIDPMGTAIKLEEYFGVFSEDIAGFFSYFKPFALEIGVIMVVLEVVLGFALLVKFKSRTVLNWLFTLILFFTFLTFYSAYFNKVTDCGCFGDFIKLTPWQSFSKDVVLLVLILVLMLQKHQFRNKALKIPMYLTVGVTVLTTGLAIYAIRHLPPIDFRPYAIGDNIQQNMQPAEAPKFVYIFEKDGERIESEEWKTPEDGYKYLEAINTNPDESIPRITDYAIRDNDGNELTDQTFVGKKFIVIIEKVKEADVDCFTELNPLISQLEKQGVECIALTADQANFEDFRHQVQLAIPYYFADATVLKAMIRSNPGLMLLQEGTVKGKWHFNDVPESDEVVEKLK